MVAARAPDVTSFSGGGPTGWTLEGFYSFFAGPSSAFLHQPARTHVPAREPGARVEPVDGKGVTITVGLGVCLRSSAGPGPTEPVHRRDARPSRVQAATAALRTLRLVCTSSCSREQSHPLQRRECSHGNSQTPTGSAIQVPLHGNVNAAPQHGRIWQSDQQWSLAVCRLAEQRPPCRPRRCWL